MADEGLLTGMIVGSSGHPMMDCLLVHYTERPLTRSQHAFNERIGKIQKAAKDGFARLYGGWAILQNQIDGDEKEWNYLLKSCCVLYNICELRGEKIDHELMLDLTNDEMMPEPDVALIFVSSMETRDAISCSLL